MEESSPTLSPHTSMVPSATVREVEGAHKSILVLTTSFVPWRKSDTRSGQLISRYQNDPGATDAPKMCCSLKSFRGHSELSATGTGSGGDGGGVSVGTGKFASIKRRILGERAHAHLKRKNRANCGSGGACVGQGCGGRTLAQP